MSAYMGGTRGSGSNDSRLHVMEPPRGRSSQDGPY